MTAVSKTLKPKIKYVNLKDEDTYKMIGWSLMAFSAVRGRWCDIPIAFLSISIAASRKELDCKASAIAGVLISSLIMSFKDIFYLPYLISSAMYTAVYIYSKKENYSLMSASIFLSISKIFTVYFSYSWHYKVYAILEGAAVYVLCEALRNGEEILKTESYLDSCTNILTEFIFVFATTISFCGFDSFLAYTAVAAGVANAWFYSSKERMDVSLIYLIGSLLAGIDKNEFSIIFSFILTIWAIGRFASEKKKMYIYPATIITAVIMNIAFLYKFVSFSIVTTSVCALLIYTFLPFVIEDVNIVKTDLNDNKDWRQLAMSMNKLQSSLNFLGGCAIDISKLNEKNADKHSVEEIVAEDICRNCDRNVYCWQEEYSFTQQEFFKYAKNVNFDENYNFSQGFINQCNKIDKLKRSFEENSRVQLSRKYILQSQKNSQKLLQEAFLSIAATVGDMVYKNQNSRLINSSVTMTMDRFLNDLNIDHSYCLCSQNPDKMYFSTLIPLDEKILYKIQIKLENIYGTSFSDANIEKQGNEILYTFSSKAQFSFDICVKTGRYKYVNGDSNIYFENDGNLYVLLSDGMGTGPLAAAESSTVIAMMQSMVLAGVESENAVNIVNLAMNLKGNSEESASVDLLKVNLFNGESVLVKAGAVETRIINKDKDIRYYGDSLPIGILKNIKIFKTEFKLTEDDTVIMVSDGVGKMGKNIKNYFDRSLESLSNFVIEENSLNDDKTVIAIRISKIHS